MRLKPIQLWCRPAMRWATMVGFVPAAAGAAKSRKPHRNLADVAVPQRTDDREGVAFGSDDAAALRHAAQGLDVGRWPVVEAAEGALADTTALAIALAQEDGGKASPGLERLRYTWRTIATSDNGVQTNSDQLHGYQCCKLYTMYLDILISWQYPM
jgi:hypothetical protein